MFNLQELLEQVNCWALHDDLLVRETPAALLRERSAFVAVIQAQSQLIVYVGWIAHRDRMSG